MGIFNTIFYQPIFNLLVFLYNIVPGQDLGLAIIALTLIIRLVLYPLSQKSIKSQKALQDINPEIEAIKEEFKDDKEKLGPAIMALYKKHKINPFSSCLPLLIQLPFLFAIYQVFYNGLTNTQESLTALYPFVSNPGTLNSVAFGFFDLVAKSWPMAILAGLAQFWQSKMMMTKQGAQKANMMSSLNKNMLYFMPAFTVIIGGQFPAGLTFYWFLTTLFSILQQYIVLRVKKAKQNHPEAVK